MYIITLPGQAHKDVEPLAILARKAGSGNTKIAAPCFYSFTIFPSCAKSPESGPHNAA